MYKTISVSNMIQSKRQKLAKSFNVALLKKLYCRSTVLLQPLIKKIGKKPLKRKLLHKRIASNIKSMRIFVPCQGSTFAPFCFQTPFLYFLVLQPQKVYRSLASRFFCNSWNLVLPVRKRTNQLRNVFSLSTYHFCIFCILILHSLHIPCNL